MNRPILKARHLIGRISLLLLLCIVSQYAYAQDPVQGQQLFKANCAVCHNVNTNSTGPALKDAVAEVPNGMSWIYRWVHSSQDVIAGGDQYAKGLLNRWNKAQMPPFPQLTEPQIDDIFAYVKQQSNAPSVITSTAQAAAAANAAPNAANGGQTTPTAGSGAAGGGDVANGKTLFAANCAVCHNVHVDATGPALHDVVSKVPNGMSWIYNWVHNSPKVLKSGDKYANDLYNRFNHTNMPPFPQLSESDINDIFAWVAVEAKNKPGASQPGGATAATGAASGGNNNSLLFGILTLALAIVAVVLMQVNNNLHRLAGEKEGYDASEPVPFYRNKRTITLAAIVLFLLSGYFLVQGAVGLGRQQNYEPEQPIHFSHRIHAGINQINCLYCHAGAEKSRQAMIPSENICMNCHKGISQYNGPDITLPDGKKVDGNAEIHKLYKYVGWDPDQRRYVKPPQPIKWTKIHNLPDFVYFNHSQHVVVGKVQCQTCHGNIQDMDEVYQFAPLSMGWCVNCHRTTKVQFASNGYYQMFEKYQKEIQQHQIDSVTVEMQGGTKCGKCHY